MHGNRMLTFEQCCGQYLIYPDSPPAPDAESLMRSRYSAFVLEREAYLLGTWDVRHRPEKIEFDHEVKWLGLTVKSYKMIDADHAQVEFVARSRLHGLASRLHEISRFERRNGRWYYVDGSLIE